MAKKKDASATPAINIGSHVSSTLSCASRSNRRLDWTRFSGSSGWAADAKEGPFATSPYSGHSPMPAGGRYEEISIKQRVFCLADAARKCRRFGRRPPASGRQKIPLD